MGQQIVYVAALAASFLPSTMHNATTHTASNPANSIAESTIADPNIEPTRAYKLDKLVLIGGGAKPKLAIDHFVDCAGGAHAKILLIPWSSSYSSAELYEYYTQEVFNLQSIAEFAVAPSIFEVIENPNAFIEQLKNYTGIFFGGGDQNKTLDLFDQLPELKLALRARCMDNDVAVCGTSAGTAIMAEQAFTGDYDEQNRPITRTGFGLLPNPVDQHFDERPDRLPRLSFLVAHQQLRGFGICAGHAAIFSKGIMRSVGGGTVDIICPKNDSAQEVEAPLQIPNDEVFDLSQ